MEAKAKHAHQPHDKNFRYLTCFIWLIKAFLEAILPKHIVDVLNMESLQILNGQLITPRSRRNLSTDFVCRIDLKHEEGCVLILIEHQSQADKMMPARMLQYAAELIKQHSDEKSKRPCPLVIPIVFYTGQAPYHLPKALGEITSGEGLFDSNLIESEFILVTPKDLEGTGVMHSEALSLFGKSFELAQKPEVLSLLSQMEKLEALEGEEYVEFKRILGDYLFKEVECQLGDQESATLEALIESRKGENNMPSLADAIKEIAEKVGKKKGIILGRQEGIIEGERKGKLEGKQEGMVEGERKGKLEGKQEGVRKGKREALLEVAQEMLDDSMDMSLISRYTGLSSEAVGQLARHQMRLT